MREDVHLDEGVVAQILAHLPAKSVLRFRAVCKDWLRITACPFFLAAHARRSPLEVLLYTTKTTKTVQGSVDLQEMDAVDVSGADHRPSPQRPLARYPVKSELRGQYCSLVASCDGLLLFLNSGVADGGPPQYLVFVCNPVRRRWTDLPRLRLSRYVQSGGFRQRGSGYYFHEPSRECRLLCHLTFTARGLAPACYCVLSTGAGADEVRRLSAQATPVAGNASDLLFKNLMTPAVLHGSLHWLKQWRSQELR